MKKQLLTFALSALSFASFATIRIADNNGSNPGNYTSLQKAIDDSNAGDTIYLKASASSYGDIVLNKPLAIIGDGARIMKPSLKTTFMNQVRVETAAGGSVLVGFEASKILVGNINKLLLDRLTVTGQLIGVDSNGNTSVSWSSILIRNCYCSLYANNTTISDLYIDNSVLTTIDIGTILKNNFIISNSILLNLYICSNVTFRNSIIEINWQHTGLNLLNFRNNLFENNLFVSLENDNLALLSTNSILNGNNFVVPSFSETFKNYKAELKSFSHDITDLRLVEGSKGKNAGTDGKDMGIYGGAFPWGDSYFSNPGLAPQVPHVMDIQTVSQTPNKASIDVNIKAKSIK